MLRYRPLALYRQPEAVQYGLYILLRQPRRVVFHRQLVQRENRLDAQNPVPAMYIGNPARIVVGQRPFQIVLQLNFGQTSGYHREFCDSFH